MLRRISFAAMLSLALVSPVIAQTGGNLGPVAPGVAATKSTMMGGQYSSVLPTFTTGQQGALQLDASGRLIVSVGGTPSLPSNAAQETGGNLASVNTNLGAPGATACATDTGSCSGNALWQRIAQRVTSLITALGTPLQAGGSVVVTSAPTTAVTLATAPVLVAGEAHVGEVGSNQITLTTALTTSNNTVTTGKSIGGLLTIANAARVSGLAGASGTGGMVQNAVLSVKDAIGSVPIDIYLFKSNPSGSTCTDNTTFALVDADRNKVIGIIHMTDWTASNSAAIGQALNLAMAYALTSATSFYGCVVTRGSAAITGVANASLDITTLRN